MQEKSKSSLTFNPGLELTAFRTTGPLGGNLFPLKSVSNGNLFQVSFGFKGRSRSSENDGKGKSLAYLHEVGLVSYRLATRIQAAIIVIIFNKQKTH